MTEQPQPGWTERRGRHSRGWGEPYVRDRVATAGELILPAARFDPEVLTRRSPQAAWEAYWSADAASTPAPSPRVGHARRSG